MRFEIGVNGIAWRDIEGRVTLRRPDRNGGPGKHIDVPEELAERFYLATGDIVAGEFEPIEIGTADDIQPEEVEDAEPDAFAVAEYAACEPVRSAPPEFERLLRIDRVNGLDREAALYRPHAQTRRSRSERVPPDHAVQMAVAPDDVTGRMLDFAAPLGLGVFGIVYGPHGSGLTRTLQSVLRGILHSAPECVCFVLLLRARGEEVTDWRLRYPDAEIVVASSALREGGAAQSLALCELIRAAAQRQTELGRDAVLIVDSLTALWGAMLEAEGADAQQEADASQARYRLREWTQTAGCFHGEAPLGGGLGGSLTLLGSVWDQPIDEEAEEERDVHPHLRLLEHLLQDAAWQVALSQQLVESRLFPAIDIRRCRSDYEERLLPPSIRERQLTVRGSLPRNSPARCQTRTAGAIDGSKDMEGLLALLERAEPEAPATPRAPTEKQKALLQALDLFRNMLPAAEQ